MPDDAQRRDAAEHSPCTLAKEIEDCIVRNALDEEVRAQKALFLLKARDRRIAFLEKRVAELENATEVIHEISLRNSSRTSTSDRDKDATSDVTQNERSQKTDDETLSNIDTTRNSTDKKTEDCDSSSQKSLSVPSLKLSKSSATNAEDVFTTPAVDFVLEKKEYFNRLFNENRSSFQPIKKSNKAFVKNMTGESETDLKTVNTEEKFDDDRKASSRQSESGKSEAAKVFISNLDEKIDERKWKNKTSASASRVNRQRSRIPRTTSSVPWIRAKHSFRRKLRSFELRSGRCAETVPALAALRTIEAGLSPFAASGEGNQEIEDIVEKADGATVVQEQRNGATVNVEGARLIAERKINTETKSILTQTSLTTIDPNNLQVPAEKINVNRSSPRRLYLKQKKFSSIWDVDEDPVPQWLIAEALSAINKDIERGERRTKGEVPSSKETEKYTSIISELEEKLSRAEMDLEKALKKKTMAKEKYKRTLENVRAEARKENEILQERIVRICTSVLENFGPRGMASKSGNNYQFRCSKRLKCHENFSSKLRKKLRVAVAKSNKLKQELAMTRAALKTETEKCESIRDCFEKLRQEMDTSEVNLNKLISENLELRKRIEDTREWVQHNMNKENHERNNTAHFRDMQRSRELTNLKKKAEEDFTTITQLRNKLLRSESANANKGFLLNSYKSQLTDLNKEKTQLLSKISGLENEISGVKSSNSQLKAKVSLLSTEKEKLVCQNKKSKADLTEKLEIRNCKNFEEAVQQEVENVKDSYDETIKSITVKLSSAKNQNMEYLKGIKDFLKKLHDSRSSYEKQNSKEDEPSEKEAQETACNILNMTPEELTGFINGKSFNSINSWTFELNRILTKNNFSENLSKFLFKKATRKLKT